MINEDLDWFSFSMQKHQSKVERIKMNSVIPVMKEAVHTAGVLNVRRTVHLIGMLHHAVHHPCSWSDDLSDNPQSAAITLGLRSHGLRST